MWREFEDQETWKRLLAQPRRMKKHVVDFLNPRMVFLLNSGRLNRTQMGSRSGRRRESMSTARVIICGDGAIYWESARSIKRRLLH